jgi:hypothetical protein
MPQYTVCGWDLFEGQPVVERVEAASPELAIDQVAAKTDEESGEASFQPVAIFEGHLTHAG